MNKNFVRAALTASLLCATAGVAAVTVSTGAVAQAQQKPAAEKPDDVKVTNPDIGKALAASQKALQAGDIAGAETNLQAAQAVPNPTPAEVYYINKFIAAIAVQKKDYATATKAYEENAASPLLPDADKKDTFHNAMFLASMAKDWTGVTNYGKQLDAINGMDDQAYGVYALAYYNMKDMTNAKLYAQKSIDMAKAAGKQPSQTAMEIIFGAEANSHDQGAAIATLEQMILQYNKPEDWNQVTNVALSTRGIKGIDALYIFRLKDLTGSFTEGGEYVSAGEIDMLLGYPTEAEKFFEEGINSGKAKAGDMMQLGKARSGAATDARSLTMLAASAAKARTGEEQLKMAEDYWGYGRYADAEAAARSAMAKGGAKDPGEGQMILGMSLVAQGKNDEAIQAFSQVSGNEGRAKAAHLWSLYAQAKKNQAGGAAVAAPAPQPPAH